MSGSESPTRREVIALKKEEGNDMCADCGQKGSFHYLNPFTHFHFICTVWAGLRYYKQNIDSSICIMSHNMIVVIKTLLVE